MAQRRGARLDPVVVGYVASWAYSRPLLGCFRVEDIDPTLCTHVIYAFAGLNETTNQIVSLDPNYDITQRGFARTVALKRRNPSLKVTIAVGGWNEGSTKYSEMAASPRTRRRFIDSVVAFISQHQFDGLDLDWEYPAHRGGAPGDRANFVLLCQELRTEFDRFGWLLTAAVGAGPGTAAAAYDLPALALQLDMLHLMAYDYHTMSDGVTGHNAPLRAMDDLNVEHSVEYYLQGGVPPSKLVLGLALYGRTFLLQDARNNAIGAPARGSAFAGPYTSEDGFLGYNEVREMQVSEQWRVVETPQAPYMFKDNKWVSYDDSRSLGRKVAFSQSRSLRGVFAWTIDTDDFRGHGGAGRYPLLTAINNALGRM